MKVAVAALHPWHVLIFDARIPLINCCRATDDPVAALQVCPPGAGCCFKGQGYRFKGFERVLEGNFLPKGPALISPMDGHSGLSGSQAAQAWYP